MTAPDDPAAILSGWREAAETSTEPDDVAFLILAAVAIPRLVAAVDEVLKYHRPVEYARGPGKRPSLCCAVCPGPPKWPCLEYLAITAALTGQEAAQ